MAKIVHRYFEPKSKVIWATTHGFVFRLLPDAPVQQEQDGTTTVAQMPAPQLPQPFWVYTETVFVQNIGKGPAEDVEVHFNFKPGNMQIWPTFNYDTETNPEGRHTVRVKSMGPREFFSLELLQVHTELPRVLRVRSKAGDAENIQMAPMQVFSPWFNRMVKAMLLFGLFSLVYFAFLLYSHFPFVKMVAE